MNGLRILARTAPLSEVMAALEVDGAVIVEDMLGTEAAQQIIGDLAETWDGARVGSASDLAKWKQFHGSNTKRFCGLAAHSDAFVEHALMNPVLTGVADEMLIASGAAADYWLNTGQVMALGEGEVSQYLHRDEGNWPEAINDDREITVSVMYALTDFTEENGATRVIPGSHKYRKANADDPHQDRWADTETVGAVMPAGAGMIYTGKVIHGAGSNTTDTWRYGMHVSFVAGWLRPEEASPLAVDRERAAQLSVRARQLLGWGSYHSDGGGRTWLVDFEDAELMFS